MCDSISRDILLCQSGIQLKYVETSKWADGSTDISDTNIDGTIYIKENNKYYVLTEFLAGNSLNAKYFGAKGDESTDDTAAIQEMMDFAWKIRDAGVYVNVYFPRGKYKLQSMVQVPNRISMKGDGINASIIFTDLTNHDLFHFRELKNQENIINPALTVNNLYTRISDISFLRNK